MSLTLIKSLTLTTILFLILGVPFKGNTNDNKVAITIDDGPGELTIKFIETLKENNATATFFLTGTKAEKNPEIVREIINNGMEIGIHSYNHDLFLLKSYKETLNDLNKTKTILENITGKEIKLVRAPYGVYSPQFLLAAKKLNLQPIGWSISINDYKNLNYQELIKKGSKADKNDIILMHDDIPNSKETIKALPKIIKNLKEKKLLLVNVSTLFS